MKIKVIKTYPYCSLDDYTFRTICEETEWSEVSEQDYKLLRDNINVLTNNEIYGHSWNILVLEDVKSTIQAVKEAIAKKKKELEAKERKAKIKTEEQKKKAEEKKRAKELKKLEELKEKYE